MYSKENSEEILKKHFGLNDLITPTRKTEKFEESDDEDDREINFEPPPEISPDILSKTPVIRLTTPIRKKSSPKANNSEDLSIPTLKDEENIQTIKITPRVSPVRAPITPATPVVDVSDEDEINERVNDLISNPSNVNYDKETKKIQDLCYEAFKIKYDNLKVNYPERKIEFPEGKKLSKIHKGYHAIIKSIYVNMNLGQIQLGYIMSLMALEFLAIKAFGIPMSGFTKMELKRMYRYNHLMIELGETFYTTGGKGGKPDPLEWRIFTSFAWNIVIFLGLKFLSKYLGGDSMTGLIRNAVDKVLDNPVTIDNIESGAAGQQQDQDPLGDMFGNLMGGGGGDLTELLANFGTNFTEKMENKKSGSKPSGKKKNRVIFTE